MEKQDKIYRIEEVKKWEKTAGWVSFGSYGLWLASIFAGSGLYTVPAFLVYTIAWFSKDYLKSLEPKTEEYKRFKMIYKEIMEEYKKLNEHFKLGNPAEVYALFDIAYSNKMFSCVPYQDARLTKHDSDLMKELTLNNHGVCRHVAMMLNDVYTQLGYKSSPIAVTTPKMKEITKEVEMPEEMKQAMKQMQEMMQIEINGHILTPDEMQVGEAKMFETRFVAEPITDKQNKHGNHAITRVESDGYTYNFDPMKRAIYIPGEGDYLIADDESQIRFSARGTKEFNKRRGIETVEQGAYLPIDEQFDMVCSTQDKILEHKDDLHDFRKLIHPKLVEAEEMYKLILK